MERHKSQIMKAPMWLVTITFVACAFGLHLCPIPYLPYYFLTSLFLIAFSVLFFMATYTYWAIKDPDRLGWSVELLRSQNSTRED